MSWKLMEKVRFLYSAYMQQMWHGLTESESLVDSENVKYKNIQP